MARAVPSLPTPGSLAEGAVLGKLPPTREATRRSLMLLLLLPFLLPLRMLRLLMMLHKHVGKTETRR